MFPILVCFAYISDGHCYNSGQRSPSVHRGEAGGTEEVEKRYFSAGQEPVQRQTAGVSIPALCLTGLSPGQSYLTYLCLNFSICKIGVMIVPTPSGAAGRIK